MLSFVESYAKSAHAIGPTLFQPPHLPYRSGSGVLSLITTARYLHVTRPRLVRVCSALELIDTEALTARERA